MTNASILASAAWIDSESSADEAESLKGSVSVLYFGPF